MFDKLSRQIEALDEQKQYFDLEWEEGHNNLLNFYVKIIPLAVNAERCSIFIHDPSTRQIWLKCGTGLAERDILVDRDAESVVGKVVDSGEYLIVDDMEKVGGVHLETDKKTGFVTHDILCVPIKSLDGKEVMGAVQVLNKNRRRQGDAKFSEDDMKLVEEMAHFLQFSIENIYFNIEATGALKAAKSFLSLITKFVLWVIGLTILAIVIRIVWVGIRYAVT